MYLPRTFLAAALAFSASAMTLPHQKRLAESEPWHLIGLSVFTSSIGSTNNSITFDIVDNNAGLQAYTTCFRAAPGSVEDPNIFWPCEDDQFNFRWDGTTLPYGNGIPNLGLNYIAEDGTATYQDSLDIAVTEMVT
ncbi:hypothetical protein E4T48_01842 [Aureobasidium sp. EXF-10727]|nr:hypothetical protein E4T48_01842 [Aureobasidium sp. EXF-10727]